MKIKPISALEEEVMKVIWELKGGSVRGVLAKISRKKPLAYTTVATVLHRLDAKGLLSRNKTKDVIYYRPIVSKASYSRKLSRSFISRLVNSFGNAAIASFAESVDRLPKDKREYFLKLLDKK